MLSINDTIEIQNLNINMVDCIQKAQSLKPWRKGPFKINDLLIDSEWKSNIKFNTLKPHLNILKNKDVADIGCNNGYYMFRMLEFQPKSLTGFDPSIRCLEQFNFINSYAKTNINYELLGVADLPNYNRKFDVIFCLGVIYHRSDPVLMLKQLKQGLNSNGVVFLDSICIDIDEPYALVPDYSYAKMSNVYFIPSVLALINWAKKAKFKNIEIIDVVKTTTNEQRKTEWINGESLENFLENEDYTIEGYPAPKRVYLKLGI